MGLLDNHSWDDPEALARELLQQRRQRGGSASTYASGGRVRRRGLLDPDPPGPDQGFAALRAGERVLNERQWRMLSTKARADVEAAFTKTGATKRGPRIGYAEGGEVLPDGVLYDAQPQVLLRQPVEPSWAEKAKRALQSRGGSDRGVDLCLSQRRCA